ncbi:glucan endo-1,3-beta-glucosidase-like [Impatiens glandulifera]|uniref:glucan endo-1,3-beta-glucosidase-like n=1 Tax=Impatiens glandulifera TaxID=253017 RepID=UPI001FB119F2|nr:glucan endo-1,3-beta-glucosidase-like [Impatiens glandulifera]
MAAILMGILVVNLFVTGALSIGVCNGGLGDNLPSDREVVRLYKLNGIEKMRIYAPKQETLQALRGSNIQLILDAPNPQELACDPSFALQWVQTNVMTYYPDVKFHCIAVGNEVNLDSNMAQYVFPAMKNVHNALISMGLGDKIKVSTATSSVLLGVSYPPSEGSFSDEARLFMDPIIKFLVETKSPFLVNIYPYFAYKGNPQDIQLSYALFTAPEIVVSDQGLKYTNLFDAMLDSTYAALEKVGGSDLEVIVSESGWPSYGGFAASEENAGTYYRNLVNHCKSGNGTPRRAGKPIDVYLFAMFDENLKNGVETEKHFGLFTPNKQPKYQLTFSGGSQLAKRVKELSLFLLVLHLGRHVL